MLISTRQRLGKEQAMNTGLLYFGAPGAVRSTDHGLICISSTHNINNKLYTIYEISVAVKLITTADQ